MVWSNVALSPLRVPRGGQPGGTACRGHPCLFWSRHHYWCEGPGPAQGLHVCGRSVQGAAGTERLISYAILPFERQSSAVSPRSRRCGEGGSPCAWNQSCARSLFSRVSVLMYASKPPAVSRLSSCATTTTRQPCRAGPDPAPCGHLRVPRIASSSGAATRLADRGQAPFWRRIDTSPRGGHRGAGGPGLMGRSLDLQEAC